MADLSRRNFLKLSLATVSVAAVLPACKSGPKELDCSDTSALSQPELMMRSTLAYVEKSPMADQQCANCAQFVAAPEANTCASCKLVKGPINPAGYCKSWTKKPAG